MKNNGTGSGDGQLRLARGLGWFSIGLGLAEVLAPGGLAKMIGVPERRAVFRALGFREIASGVAILTQTQPAPGLCRAWAATRWTWRCWARPSRSAVRAKGGSLVQSPRWQVS